MKVVRLHSLSGYRIKTHYEKGVKIASRLRNKAGSGDKILLDLTSMEWTTPAFITPVSVAYNQLTDQGNKIDIRLPPGYGRRSYLNQIGFPSGYDFPPGGYDTYLPLCRINADGGVDVIESVLNGLIELIRSWFKSISDGNPQTVHYPISETVKNIGEHSNSDYGAVLVQHYPSNDYLDICVVDDGISIPGNFESHDINFESDCEAIERAMRGEESTKEGDEWKDRGCGLKTTARLVCEGLDGTVLIASRGGACMQENNTISSWGTSRKPWDGTIFIARLCTPGEDFRLAPYVIP